jgi:hypothetical protein
MIPLHSNASDGVYEGGLSDSDLYSIQHNRLVGTNTSLGLFA